MSISVLPVDPVQVELAPYRQVRIHGRSYSLVPPSTRDPRIHLAAVIISIFVLGITWLGFQVSIAQILVTVLTCAVIEVSVTARRTPDARLAGKCDADRHQHRVASTRGRHRER